MSTAIDETNTSTEESAPVEPERNVPARDDLDTLRGLLLTKAETLISEFRAVSARLDAQDNTEKALPDLRRTSDNPTVKALQEKIDKAEAAIAMMQKQQDEILLADIPTMSDEEREAAEKVRAKVRESVKHAVAIFDDTSAEVGDDATVADYVEDLSSVVRTRSASSTSKSGDGSGTRRLRVKALYIFKGLNPEGKDFTHVGGRFTDLVNYFDKNEGVKVQTSSLHSALFTAAGTEDLDAMPVTNDFPIKVKDTDYWVRVVKKSD